MHHCGRFIQSPLTRRQMLSRCASGFGAVALAGLMNRWAPAAAVSAGAAHLPQYPAKAKSVIFLYMDGGPSHVDTFDYKPLLERFNGQDPYKAMGKLEPTQFANVGKVMQSPWKFRRYGQSGAWVSDLFPHLAKVADELAFVRSMTSDFSEHTNANFFLHTGSGLQGRPSMGAWATYGLGSECQDLPGFIVINGGLIPPGGLDNFNSGFLPATFQGSVFKPGMPGVTNAQPTEATPRMQQRKLALMRRLDAGVVEQTGKLDSLESAIANYELAYRMQSAVPELMDLARRNCRDKAVIRLRRRLPADPHVRHRVPARPPAHRARRALRRTHLPRRQRRPLGPARRPLRRPHQELQDGRSTHRRPRSRTCAAAACWMRRWWSGRASSAGRLSPRAPTAATTTPTASPSGSPAPASRPAQSYGATDEWGYKAAENRCNIHDLHATMLHLMGIDHTKLTFRFSGRDMRLTDVYGEVLHDVLT